MNNQFQSSENELAQRLLITNHTDAKECLEIEATLEEWANFLCEKNVNGVLSIYTEDAMNFDLMAPLQYQGIETIRERISSWLSSFENDIVVDIQELRIHANSHLGFAHCLIRFMGDKKGDARGEDMYNRVTFGLEKIGNDWLIAHEHNSLPFNMKTGKIELELRPNDLN